MLVKDLSKRAETIRGLGGTVTAERVEDEIRLVINHPYITSTFLVTFDPCVEESVVRAHARVKGYISDILGIQAKENLINECLSMF